MVATEPPSILKSPLWLPPPEKANCDPALVAKKIVACWANPPPQPRRSVFANSMLSWKTHGVPVGDGGTETTPGPPPNESIAARSAAVVANGSVVLMPSGTTQPI